MEQGKSIGIRIDQTLTQDATGTTAFLLFESMGIGRVKTEKSVSYIDHNMSQFGPENHNDHLYLQTVAAKSGAFHSRAGNGICHQVHLERFGRSGATLLGSDSHTPTGGGVGMLAIGAGGMDVAVAMGGGAFYLTSPKVIGVKLSGKLNDWVGSKDIIIKTGIMVGLGETHDEVEKLMCDFYAIGGDVLTIGQYLSCGRNFYPVKEYIKPKVYKEYQEIGENIGIKTVFAGPFVRSSYSSKKIYFQEI